MENYVNVKSKNNCCLHVVYDTNSTSAFMSKSVYFNKYDIFLSYPQEIQSKILSLYETLTNLYGLNVWIDLQQSSSNLSSSSHQRFSSSTDGLSQSKVFVPCLNDAYVKSEACEKEIQLAISQKKHILVLLLENKPLTDYGRIGQLLGNFTKIDFYRDPDAIDKWSGLLFNKFIDVVELMICRKINRIQTIAVNGASNLSTAACKLVPRAQPRKYTTSRETTRIYGFNQVKSSKPLNLPAKHLTRMAYLHTKKRILFCDIDGGCLLLTDTLGSYMKKIILVNVKKPYCICVGKRHEIFVADKESEKISVFDTYFAHIRNLNYKLPQTRFEMSIDEENDHIFISDYDSNKITILDGSDGTEIDKIDIKKPTYIKIKFDRIYVISEEEQIIVLRKDTFDELQQIKIGNWTNVRGLHIDNKMNIMTSAFEKNFPIAFFYLINSDGGLTNKVYVHMKDIQDFVVIDKRFFFNTEITSPCVLEFQ